jgi:hypothetical protein
LLAHRRLGNGMGEQVQGSEGTHMHETHAAAGTMPSQRFNSQVGGTYGGGPSADTCMPIASSRVALLDLDAYVYTCKDA